MSRYTTVTLGFLLVFIGIKFHMVESYFLTPKATQFWLERIEEPTNTVQNNGFGNGNYANYSNSYNQYSGNYLANNGIQNNPFQNASYQTPYGGQGPLANRLWPQKQITTPRWLGWPVLFLGAVFVLHGAAMRRS